MYYNRPCNFCRRRHARLKDVLAEINVREKYENLINGVLNKRPGCTISENQLNGLKLKLKLK